jgi:hypothetical protein
MAGQRRHGGHETESRVTEDGRTERLNEQSVERSVALLLPWASHIGLLDGPKIEDFCLVTWATTRAMAWAALVLGPPKQLTTE